MTPAQSLLLALAAGAGGFTAGAVLDPLSNQPFGAMPVTAVTDSADPENQIIAKLQQRLAGALAPLDSVTLDSLASDDFLAVNAGGVVLNKSDVFRVLATLPYELLEVIDDSIHVRRQGPFAIVTAIETVKGRTADGPVTGQLRLYHVWVKRGNRWQTVGGQAALVQPLPPN